MFTGIVAAVGRVRSVRQTNRDLRIEIESALNLAGVAIGASVLCAGCCLTLIDKGEDWFAVEAIDETRALATAGQWRAGTAINLERSMRLGGEIDGHVVTGHVDGMGEVVAIAPEGGARRVRIRAPAPLHRLIAKKGSVAVDGVSLTVTDADRDTFEVCIIPHTSDVTTLGALAVGAAVNIEVDTFARYIARWVETQAPVAPRGLTIVARARLPLEGAEDSEIVCFQPADGGPEHCAVLIGAPPASEPVLTRLHSGCFTGDVLGSLRCDCGPQLRGAIAEIAKAGGGIVLYLAQEGRGIGLANKLRAYSLQDQGLDTFEANEQLGFAADERHYGVAARMLALLGYGAVRLMTNNPAKIAGLEAEGIAVTARVRHAFAENKHNSAYLRAKAEKAGHML